MRRIAQAALDDQVMRVGDDLDWEEIEAVVHALVSGTHELQERVSGDTVRVPLKEVEGLYALLDVADELPGDECQRALSRVESWLSGDKP